MPRVNYFAMIVGISVMTLVATGSALAQDPVITLPDAYRLQFENEWVKVVRVKYAADAKLPEHGHPAASLAFVYLTDADPVVFTHSGSSTRSVTRPAVKAGSYRLARGDSEVHSVANDSPTASEFLRVELKTNPAGVRNFRRRVPVPARRGNESSTEVEFSNAQVRISRIRIAAGDAVDVITSESEPALILALTGAALTVTRASSMSLSLAVGQEHWVDTRQRERMANTGSAPIELLRFDFLTPPASKSISGDASLRPPSSGALPAWPASPGPASSR